MLLHPDSYCTAAVNGIGQIYMTGSSSYIGFLPKYYIMSHMLFVMVCLSEGLA